MSCRGCGGPLPPTKGPGRRREWCSERCRKRQYDGVCSGCGGRFSGTDPNRKVTTLCDACVRQEIHERSVAWLVAEAHHWLDLYGEQPSASEWHLAGIRWRQRAYAEGRASGRFNRNRVIELERRHTEDGPWPHLNAVRGVFGSWSAFMAVAGFEVLASGSGRRKRVAA